MMVTGLKLSDWKHFRIRALVSVFPSGNTFLVNSFDMKSPLKQKAISKFSNRSLCVRISGFVMVRL